ncbi:MULTISPECIES: hypothetical protein [Streptomyces]|uniref:hypothetical protein n=1 Tax=Streptomyces TaxID=1883 RepID=UPI00372475B0
MSPTKKKLIVVAFCVMFAVIVGLVVGVVVSALGATALESTSAGGGAFAVVCGIGVAIISLFDFEDGRQAPPTQSQQGAPIT